MGAPQVQAGTLDTSTGAITFLPGSSASDPSGVNGAAVIFDNPHSWLIQGEQGTSSLSAYTNSEDTLSFVMQTPLEVSTDAPTAFAKFGKTLFVDRFNNGDIEACALSENGVSGCATVAVHIDTSGTSAGLAIL